MQAGLLIGAVAARSGVSRKTLRRYEARGLLPPSGRTASGYRVYPDDVLDVVAFVGRARQLGLTLAEITRVVALRRAGRPPCAHVRALLRVKVRNLEGLLRELRRTLRSWDTANGRPAAIYPRLEHVNGSTKRRRQHGNDEDVALPGVHLVPRGRDRRR